LSLALTPSGSSAKTSFICRNFAQPPVLGNTRDEKHPVQVKGPVQIFEKVLVQRAVVY